MRFAKAVPRIVGSRFMQQTKTCLYLYVLWDPMLEYTRDVYAIVQGGQSETNKLIRLMLVYLQQSWRKHQMRAAALCYSDVLGLVFHEIIYVKYASKVGAVFNSTVEHLQALIDDPKLLVKRIQDGEPLMPRTSITFLLDAKHSNQKLSKTVRLAAEIARADARVEHAGETVQCLINTTITMCDSFRHYVRDWLSIESGKFSPSALSNPGYSVQVFKKKPSKAKTMPASEVLELVPAHSNEIESNHGLFDAMQKSSCDTKSVSKLGGQIMAVKNRSLAMLLGAEKEKADAHIVLARKNGPQHALRARARHVQARQDRYLAEKEKAHINGEKLRAQVLLHSQYIIKNESRLNTVVKLKAASKAAADQDKDAGGGCENAQRTVLEGEVDLYAHLFKADLGTHRRPDGKPLTQKSVSSGKPLPLKWLRENVTTMIKIINKEKIEALSPDQHAARKDVPVDARELQPLDVGDFAAVERIRDSVASLPARIKFQADKKKQQQRMSKTQLGSGTTTAEKILSKVQKDDPAAACAAGALAAGDGGAAQHVLPVHAIAADKLVVVVDGPRRGAHGVVLGPSAEADKMLVRFGPDVLHNEAPSTLAKVEDPTIEQLDWAAEQLAVTAPTRLLRAETGGPAAHPLSDAELQAVIGSADPDAPLFSAAAEPEVFATGVTDAEPESDADDDSDGAAASTAAPVVLAGVAYTVQQPSAPKHTFFYVGEGDEGFAASKEWQDDALLPPRKKGKRPARYDVG